MSIPRLSCEATLSPGAEIAATPAQAHHLGNVLRRGPGDPVRLFNAEDGEFDAEVVSLRKDRGSFRVGALVRPAAPEPPLTLLVAALKRDAMDWLVEKATELGVTHIRPVLTHRSVAAHANIDRLAAIARGAAEQCERLGVPRIDAALPLHAVLDSWPLPPLGEPLLVAAERRQSPPIRAIARALLIGPEGGFTTPELDGLAARPFVALCRLGPRILRAETAAVAGLAALQALGGDWTDLTL